MNKTRQEIEDAGTHTAVKIAVEVLVDKKTGNILYICEKCNRVMDRYISLTDPTFDKDRPVNQLCSKCRRKHQRKPVPSLLLSFLFDMAWARVSGEWVRIGDTAEERSSAYLRDKLGWAFN